MTNQDGQSGERKIIIDEDWKAQVEAEREQIRKQQEEGAEDGPSPSAESEMQGELPPASITVLITTLSAQSLAAMGQIPDPSTGQPMLNLEFAKLHIDTLAVLQEKTQGNLTAEEANILEDTLHQLRMLFVEIQKQLAQQQGG